MNKYCSTLYTIAHRGYIYSSDILTPHYFGNRNIVQCLFCNNFIFSKVIKRRFFCNNLSKSDDSYHSLKVEYTNIKYLNDNYGHFLNQSNRVINNLMTLERTKLLQQYSCNLLREIKEDDMISISSHSSTDININFSAYMTKRVMNMKKMLWSRSYSVNTVRVKEFRGTISAVNDRCNRKKGEDVQYIISLFEKHSFGVENSTLHPLKTKGKISSLHYSIQRKKEGIQENQRKQTKKYKYHGSKLDHEVKEEKSKWIYDSSSAIDHGIIHHHLSSDSRRKPHPICHPANRRNPPPDFLNMNKSFLFINDIPYLSNTSENIVEESTKKLEFCNKSLHKKNSTEYIANLLGVDVKKVFLSNMTSAFIGFESAKDATNAYLSTNGKRVISKSVKASLYNQDVNDHDFVKVFTREALNFNKSIVKLVDVPIGSTKILLAHSISLTINQNENKKKILQIDEEDILFITPTTALMRLISSHASLILSNDPDIKSALINLGTWSMKFHVAKREVIPIGYIDPTCILPRTIPSDKIIVDGDTPFGNFFITHGGMLHLSHLHPSITKQDITAFFQPYCLERRDENGSVQFVRTIDGVLTGCAFVGFDLESEALTAWNDLGHNVKTGPINLPMRIRLVKEKRQKGEIKSRQRLHRTEEELFENLHLDWEKFVDKTDVKVLESMCVPKSVLEEAFMTVRFQNRSFGMEDLTRKRERLRECQTPGQHFRDFVKLYTNTLKEVSSNRNQMQNLYGDILFLDKENDISVRS